jgi:phosphonate transport system permease protein
VVILGIIFVIMFGYGPLAGVLTLIVNGVGFIGKLLAEDIENIQEEQIEAIRATGASWPKIVVYAVWPQVATRFIGLSIYRADISFRQSTIIGIVGAGGIGAVLDTAMGRYDFNTAGAILLVIIIMVLITEYISSSIRRRIV